MPRQNLILHTTHWALRAAVVLNVLFIVSLLAALGAILLAPNLLGVPAEIVGISRSKALNLGALGITGVLVGAVLTLLIFWTVATLLESAISGDPFDSENASKVARMGWLLLGINAVEVLTRLAVHQSAPEIIRGKFDALDVSPISLLGVLLVFVLAQIFRRGSEMRTELAGTI